VGIEAHHAAAFEPRPVAVAPAAQVDLDHVRAVDAIDELARVEAVVLALRVDVVEVEEHPAAGRAADGVPKVGFLGRRPEVEIVDIVLERDGRRHRCQQSHPCRDRVDPLIGERQAERQHTLEPPGGHPPEVLAHPLEAEGALVVAQPFEPRVGSRAIRLDRRSQRKAEAVRHERPPRPLADLLEEPVEIVAHEPSRLLPPHRLGIHLEEVGLLLEDRPREREVLDVGM
jgi:hypothetical protein